MLTEKQLDEIKAWNINKTKNICSSNELDRFINDKNFTLYDYILKVFEMGRGLGVEQGKFEKINEIKGILNIEI